MAAFNRTRRSGGLAIVSRVWRLVSLSLALLCPAALAAAQEEQPAAPAPIADEAADEAPAFGALIRVPLPLTGNVDNRIMAMIQRVQDRAARHEGRGERPVLVLEFVPSGSEFGEGTDFTRALGLARYLSSREIAGIKTVAYIPRTIKGHAVLVAMACEEIIMTRGAELGDAGVDEPAEAGIEPAVRSGYTQLAERRRTIPTAVALGMLDKNLEVLQVETDVSVEYVLRQDLEELEERRSVQSTEVLIPRGELGRFSGGEGRSLGFVKYLASNRQAVARALDLPPDALQEDPSLGGKWKAVQLKLSGQIGPQAVSQMQSMIGDAMQSDETNLLLLRIDSPGGSLADSMRLANYLASLDRGRVRTVAYVAKRAGADAALIAVAADQLVMQPDATLGGTDEQPIPEGQAAAARESIRSVLAAEKSRNWSLLAALVDADLTVHRYTHRQNGLTAYFSEAELDEQENPEQWLQGDRVTRPGEVLQADGERAKQLGLATDVVANFDELKKRYGLRSDPPLIEPNWAELLIEALARPEFATLLLILGGVAVYAELNSPGIGIGGFIASVCFLLFFWSKFLDGTAGWLEVMLFLAGISFLLMEIFLIPGFGVFGLGGGALIILSLVLASQTFVLPHNESQLSELRDSLIVVGGAMLGMIAVALVLRRYLPQAPFFNRMLLAPPVDERSAQGAAATSGYDYRHLLGQQGTAATQLTPSGKARFGDELCDVIANGEVINRGAAIEVVLVRGNHVYVQSVGDAE